VAKALDTYNISSEGYGKLKLYHDKHHSLLRPYKGRQHNAKYKGKIEDFRAHSLSQLFDIAACKCLDTAKCICKKERRVPAAERNFLEDQSHGRTMMIGGVDVKMKQRLQQRNMCKNMELKRESNSWHSNRQQKPRVPV